MKKYLHIHQLSVSRPNERNTLSWAWNRIMATRGGRRRQKGKRIKGNEVVEDFWLCGFEWRTRQLTFQDSFVFLYSWRKWKVYSLCSLFLPRSFLRDAKWEAEKSRLRRNESSYPCEFAAASCNQLFKSFTLRNIITFFPDCLPKNIERYDIFSLLDITE